jgi:TolB protein
VYDSAVEQPKFTPGPATLFLTDPLGGRYTLFTWPPKGPAPYGQLLAWSRDGRHALFGHVPARNSGGFGPTYQLDVRTGKFTKIPVDPKSLVVGYAAADDQLLVEGDLNGGTGVGTVELVSMHGTITRKLWTGFIATDPVPAPDGTDYVITANDDNYLVSSTGKVIRRLGSHGGCAPVRWWSDATLLAACMMNPPSDSGDYQMWLIQANGKAPTALTPQRPVDSGPDQGDFNYFRLTSGEYLDAMGAMCGNHVVARLEPRGKVAIIKVPGATESTIEAATASRLLLLIHGGSCGGLPGPGSLLWLDPKTGAKTPVITAGKGQFGVLAVVPYHDEGPR